MRKLQAISLLHSSYFTENVLSFVHTTLTPKVAVTLKISVYDFSHKPLALTESKHLFDF